MLLEDLNGSEIIGDGDGLRFKGLWNGRISRAFFKSKSCLDSRFELGQLNPEDIKNVITIFHHFVHSVVLR